MSLYWHISFQKRIITYLQDYTFINQYDQGMIDTLSIGKAVLKQLKVGEKQIPKLSAKSDNASCYHGNYLPRHHVNHIWLQWTLQGQGSLYHECDGLETISKSMNVHCANAVFLTQVGIQQMLTWLPVWKEKSLYHIGTFLPTWFFLPLQKFKTIKIKLEKNPYT